MRAIPLIDANTNCNYTNYSTIVCCLMNYARYPHN